MKILITTDTYVPFVNGVVTSVTNLIEQLEWQGHEVRVLTLSPNHTSYQKERIYYVKSSPFKVYPNVRMPISYHNRFIQELIAWRPDIIHSQCEFFTFEFAKKIADKTGAPMVHTYHTLYEQYACYIFRNGKVSNLIISRFMKDRLKGVECVIAPTGKVRRTLQRYGLEPPIEIVPTGISLEKFNQRMSREEILQKRRQYDIPEDYYVLASVGRLGYEKNVAELLRYFAALLLKRQDLTLMVVGDGPARESLEKLSGNLGIQQHVIFTGMICGEEIREYYQMADLFLCASTSETQGLTYVEAMANGLPLICRDDPCLEGVIYQGRNGYCYTSQEGFLEAVEQVLDQETWRDQAKAYNLSLAYKFSKQQFGLAVEEIYKNVLYNRTTVGVLKQKIDIIRERM